METLLCLDFGTSSMRAALRTSTGEIISLNIGAITKAQLLDDASILSAIRVSEGKEATVQFGEEAHRAQLENRNVATFYNQSPKLMLLEPGRLSEAIGVNSTLSKRDLLVGLLAYAFDSCRKASKSLQKSEKVKCVRVTHPVWPMESVAALQEITHAALGISKGFENLRTPQMLETALSKRVATKANTADGVEPQAAAVSLLPEDSNIRELCLIVDVGAGTTDIGLYQHVNPDVSSKVRQKFYALAEPLSIHFAGDSIDSSLERLMRERLPDTGASLVRLQTQIRQLKEQIFNQGEASFQGIVITEAQLTSTPEVKQMRKAIRCGASKLIEAAGTTYAKWLPETVQKIGHLKIVMAGGGARLPFLKKELSNSFQCGDTTLRAHVPDSVQRFECGASLDRLAVSRGGASIKYDDMQHERQAPQAILGLGRGIHTPLADWSQPNELLSGYTKKQLTRQSPATEANLSETPKQDTWLTKVTKLKSEADSGDPEKQYQVARALLAHSKEHQTARDAKNWLSLAAEQGHADARTQLGLLYARGLGVSQDLSSAYFWFLMAARSGSKEGRENAMIASRQLPSIEEASVRERVTAWLKRN